MQPAPRVAACAPHAGRDVVFGLRPEHVGAANGAAGFTVPGRVLVVEPLGSEVFAYLSTDGHEFIARMDASVQPRPGESIETVFDTDHLHIFDKETEQALA